MKFMVSIAAVLLLIAFCDAYERLECEPGDVFDQDCNSCTCTGAGVYECTFRKCFGKQRLQASATNSIDQVCTPNDTKAIECNRCRCSQNGAGWLCTRRFCPSPDFQQQRRFKRDCTYADVTRGNCSTTRQAGTFDTTTVSLFPGFFRSSEKTGGKNKITTETTLKPNSKGSRKNRISTPTTESTTQSFSTTIPNLAIREFTEADLEDPNFRCEPKEVFKVDCNTCWCDKEGKGPKTCTRIACKPSVYEPLISN